MMELICTLAACFPLSYAAVRDAEDRIIPNRAVLLIALCALPRAVLEAGARISMLAGGLALGGTLLLAALIRKDSVGGGDIKLSAAIGLLFGVQTGALLLLTALLLLILWGTAVRVRVLPFAPFLLVAVLFWVVIKLLWIGVNT